MRIGSSPRTVFGGLALLALACRFSEQTVTQAVAPSETAPVLRDCEIAPGQPGVPEAQAGELLQYLNRGGSLVTLSSHLENLQQLAQPFKFLDLDGNHLKDLVIATIGEDSGSLQVFLCVGDQYRLAYISLPGTVVVRSTADITGDLIDDLLITRDECGAHTCTAEVEVLAWIEGRLANRFRGDTSDLPSPQYELQPNASGSMEIRITATGIGSAGAGPYRLRTRAWTWESEQALFIPGQEVVHPSSVRIHVLHDADDAAAVGNYDAALAYYQRVIDDPTLDDTYGGPSGRTALAAYAHYRRMITIAQLGDRVSAEQAMLELSQRVPEGSIGHGFALLGEQFWQAHQESRAGSGILDTEAISAGCRAAQAYAITHPATTLDLLYYGYANRIYGPESICPLEP